MPVPLPNDDPSWGGLVVDGLREVKESIAALSRDMNAKMAVLVSQREFDHTRDELTIDIAELRSKIDNGLVRHDSDILSVRESSAAQVKALKDALDEADERRRVERKADEQKRRAERWTALGALLTILGLLLAVVLHYY